MDEGSVLMVNDTVLVTSRSIVDWVGVVVGQDGKGQVMLHLIGYRIRGINIFKPIADSFEREFPVQFCAAYVATMDDTRDVRGLPGNNLPKPEGVQSGR